MAAGGHGETGASAGVGGSMLEFAGEGDERRAILSPESVLAGVPDSARVVAVAVGGTKRAGKSTLLSTLWSVAQHKARGGESAEVVDAVFEVGHRWESMTRGADSQVVRIGEDDDGVETWLWLIDTEGCFDGDPWDHVVMMGFVLAMASELVWMVGQQKIGRTQIDDLVKRLLLGAPFLEGASTLPNLHVLLTGDGLELVGAAGEPLSPTAYMRYKLLERGIHREEHPGEERGVEVMERVLQDGKAMQLKRATPTERRFAQGEDGKGQSILLSGSSTFKKNALRVYEAVVAPMHQKRLFVDAPPATAAQLRDLASRIVAALNEAKAELRAHTASILRVMDEMTATEAEAAAMAYLKGEEEFGEEVREEANAMLERMLRVYHDGISRVRHKDIKSKHEVNLQEAVLARITQVLRARERKLQEQRAEEAGERAAEANEARRQSHRAAVRADVELQWLQSRRVWFDPHDRRKVTVGRKWLVKRVKAWQCQTCKMFCDDGPCPSKMKEAYDKPTWEEVQHMHKPFQEWLDRYVFHEEDGAEGGDGEG